MYDYKLPEIKPDDQITFFAVALPDPTNTLRFVPAVTCYHNGTPITLWSPITGTYTECLDEANRIAQTLQRRYGTFEAIK